jgi:Tfp pilus assembly protein PilF
MFPLVAVVEAVQAAPAPQERTYEAAVADRLAGENLRAVAGLSDVLARQPDHVDARLNLGLSLLSLGRLDEAEAAFNQVLVLAPTYADARIGLAQVARRRGQADRALAEARLALDLDPGRPDTRALLRDLEGVVTRVDVDGVQSHLSGGLANWSEQRLAITHSPSRDWAFGGAIERTRRFDLVDVQLEARMARRWQEGHAYVAVSATPDADYRAERAVYVGGARRLAAGWEATLDASLADYAVGTVRSVQPGLAVTLAQGQLRLAGRWIQTWDERDTARSGYALQAAWNTSERLRLRADFADAPESSEGRTIDVQSYGLGAEFAVSEHVSLRGFVLKEDRGAVDRSAWGFGLGWRY